MDQRRKDNLLTYLMTGRLYFSLNQHPYFFSVPSTECRIIAHNAYEEALYKSRFEKWFNNETALNILIRRGIVSPTIDQNIKSLEQSLEDLKVNLFRASFRTTDEKKIKKEIELVREQIERQEKLKSDIYHLTLEGFAARVKFTILIAASIHDGKTERRIYNNKRIMSPDPYLIELVTYKKNEFEPKTSELREIARTQPWKTTWTLGKPNPYNKPIIEINEHQQSLMVYSNMYDNIRESLDCPTDRIIEDDDMCDGWLIIQNRKREKELREKQTEQIMGKKSKEYQELFMPAKTKEDAKNILAMNDTGSRITIAQRQKQIEKQGLVKDSDLFDNKVKKQGMSIEQFKERTKK